MPEKLTDEEIKVLKTKCTCELARPNGPFYNCITPLKCTREGCLRYPYDAKAEYLRKESEKAGAA